jgi:hypothetical protein
MCIAAEAPNREAKASRVHGSEFDEFLRNDQGKIVV